MDLNKAQIIGNVTRDPEVRETPNGSKVANFGIATNRYWNDPQGNRQEQVEYHNLVAWGNTAGIVEQFVHKGKKLYIEGRLQTRSWEDQTGSKRYSTEIVAENVILLGGRDDNGGSNSSSVPAEMSVSASKPKEEKKVTTKTTAKPKDDEISIEDVPF